MTLDTAADIVAGYSKALCTPVDGVARRASLLPASHRDIVHATKLTLASAVQQRRITRELAQSCEMCIGHLPAFIDDAIAKRINYIQKQLIQKHRVSDTERAEYTEFTKQMYSLELVQEINDFLGVLARLNPDDSSFWDIATRAASNQALQPTAGRHDAQI
jgi:hypothetical protein